MKKFLTLLILTSLSCCVFAQQANQIIGKVENGIDRKTMNTATIFLLKTLDSALIKTSVSDKDGNFVFEDLAFGSYVVMANAVGHLKAYSEVFRVDSFTTSLNIGTIALFPVSKNLAAVVVTSKKQFVERRLDKTIINPDALISNTGSTAMEVLEKAPGVSVDKDGNISLKGKQGVIIMLDGKPSYMTGADLANFLNNLSSSNLELIEIMNNPSAKYDASGNAGVINLKTKKNKQKGFNGSTSLSYGQGFYSKTNNSANLNYRTEKINFFSSFGVSYRKGFQFLDISRRYSNADNTLKANFTQNTSKTRENYNYNLKVGADFYATKKTSFGIVFTGYSTPASEQGNSVSYPRNSLDNLDSIVTALRAENSRWKNTAVNLNFQHNFDSSGRQLTADVDFLHYRSDKDQRFDNIIYNPDWSTKYADQLLGELPSDINIYSAKIDYTQQLKKIVKMEAGLKFSYVATDNTADYFNVIDDLKTVDIKKTNRFQYKENVNAAYINFSKTIKKWGFQAGVRLENTFYEGHQFGNEFRPEVDSIFKRSYTNAFPTTYISYSAGAKNEFGFSFGRRIERPAYEDLNPFLFFLDKYTFEEGNPFLKPMYSNTMELTHTYNQFLTTTLNYSHTKDLFNEVFRQNNQPDDSISTIITRGNYGLMNNLSLSVNAQIKISKCWNMMAYAEGRYQKFKGILYGDKLNVQAGSFIINLNNQFNFKKGWSAELSGFFRSKTPEGQLVIRSMSQADIGLKKDILKSKGSIKFSVRDFYGPREGKGKIDFQQTAATFRQHNDSRVATISFNYRFGKVIKAQQKRRTGGAGEEQNRVKTSN